MGNNKTSYILIIPVGYASHMVQQQLFEQIGPAVLRIILRDIEIPFKHF